MRVAVSAARLLLCFALAIEIPHVGVKRLPSVQIAAMLSRPASAQVPSARND
ncbi:MAG: hypothetical protein AB7S93_22630 [Xanthobacteraceae bacterium]